MTHEELLSEIDRELRMSDYDTWLAGARALRAVVELHQPIWTFPVTSNNSIPVCIQCRDGDFIADYPCNTIQAIEKELS